MFHVKRRWRLAVQLLAVLGACGIDEDQLFRPESAGLREFSDGIYQLTHGPGPDYAIGFDPLSGRVLYRTRGLDERGDWRIHSISVAGGGFREEAALYRIALRAPVAALAVRPGVRVLSIANHPISRGFGCAQAVPGAPPIPCMDATDFPSVTGIALMQLPSTDGAALSSLPVHVGRFPVALPIDSLDASTGVRVFGDTLRTTWGERDRHRFGTDPYAPAVTRDGNFAFYSDGDVVWRVQFDRPGERDSVAAGVYPDLSPDGRLLALAVPVDLDSTFSQCVIVLDLLVQCQQRFVLHSAAGWRSFVLDLEAGDTLLMTEGTEPAFSADGARLLVRRLEGLVWVARSNGAEEVLPGTAGAYAPALAPDGTGLVFSMDPFRNPDVFYVPIDVR